MNNIVKNVNILVYIVYLKQNVFLAKLILIEVMSKTVNANQVNN